MTSRRRVVLAGLAVAAIAATATIVGVPAFLNLNTYLAPIEGYRRGSDERQLVVTALLRPGETIVGTEVREEPDRVAVGVRARTAASTVGLGVRQQITVTLKDPLQQRTVVDWSGQTVSKQ